MTAPDRSIIPELERLLVDAAERRIQGAEDLKLASDPGRGASAIDPAGRPGRRRFGRLLANRVARRPTIVVLAAITAGGTAAVAATRPWAPLLGNDVGGHPTPSVSAPPSDQLQRLAVLREPQTESDRGSGVQADLRTIGSQNVGVRTAYVRLLGATSTGAAVALIPTERFSDEAAGPALAGTEDALCVFYPASRPAARFSGADYPCWTTPMLLRGRAVARVADGNIEHVFGLVPDGIARVELTLGDGTIVTTAPRANFFDAALPPATSPFTAIQATRWFDANGAAVGPT
jgi:hypothetical protein